MANNRIYLKCACGSEVFLAKRFGEGYYTAGNDEGTEPRLDKWFDEHEFCGGSQFTYDHFELVYETNRE